MSSQKRYRDWKSSLLSKDSVENLAYLDGIGPKFGWDKATWNGTQLSLGSNNVEATASKYRYIANRSGAIETPTNGVVTPDGIFTVTTGNEIFVITGLDTTREVLVYATHNYVEADIPTPTTFHAVPITGTVERLPSILAEGSNMAKWIATANLITSIDQTNSVIIGIYKLPATAGDVTEMAIPYHYSWKDGKSLGGEDGGGAFSFEIKDGSITTAKLSDGSVTTAKIADGAVTDSKIASGAITINKLSTGLRIIPFYFTITYKAAGSTLSIASSISGITISAEITNKLTVSTGARPHILVHSIKCTLGGITYGIEPHSLLPRVYVSVTKPTGIHTMPGWAYSFIIPSEYSELPVVYSGGKFAVAAGSLNQIGMDFVPAEGENYYGYGMGTLAAM